MSSFSLEDVDEKDSSSTVDEDVDEKVSARSSSIEESVGDIGSTRAGF